MGALGNTISVSGSSGVAAFIRLCPGGRQVSCRVFWFIGVHPGGRRIRPRSQGSLWCALSVIGLNRCRWVYSGAPSCSSGLRPVGRRRVNWSASLCSSGSCGVAGFMGVRPGTYRVNAESLSSLVLAMGSFGSYGVTGFIWVRPRGLRVRHG